MPSEQQDPGLFNRHTGETIFDLYTMEGELLWRINMGINISSSSHHNVFHFYDFTQTGRAHFAIKTADGTRVYHPTADGTICDLRDEPVFVIGDRDAVWVGTLQNPAMNNEINSGVAGRIRNGVELFTIFDGLTGTPIDTVPYFAPYDIMEWWGDNNNNRSDRFMGAVAYLPKYNDPSVPYPSIVEIRGHYGPHFVAAYQLTGEGRIEKVWEFRLEDWVGPGGIFGNHNLAVADLTRNGFDDIVFGSLVLREDGTPLWIQDGSRGTMVGTHGDALHLSVMSPFSDDFFVFTPHESPPPNHVNLYRGTTGAAVWSFDANTVDVGRATAANLTNAPGFEIWASAGTPVFNMLSGAEVRQNAGMSINYRIYWSGDLLSELLDGRIDEPLSISKVDPDNPRADLSIVQTLHGTISNNGTKATPGITADLFGSWREEIVVRTDCHNFLRIYTTNIPTEYVIYTLMHDPTYRLAVARQNSVYNQPNHLGFYLGNDIRERVLAMELPVFRFEE
jgi:hypothetical protein